MRILVVWNASDRRCGFQNYGAQTVRALANAGHHVVPFDGTYSQVYQRREAGADPFLPENGHTYDVIHVIWHAMTLNHYSGATWPKGPSAPLLSFWDGGPSNCWCPFVDAMDVKWCCYPKEGYRDQWYAIPDWVDDVPAPDPQFTVGVSSIRGDGVPEIVATCERNGWAINQPAPDQWIPLEDEVRRLARSTVNVSWYDTIPLWKDRAGGPSTLLASGRPLLITDDSLLGHLVDAPDLYHGKIAARGGPDLETSLKAIEADWTAGTLRLPQETVQRLSWSESVKVFEQGWAR